MRWIAVLAILLLALSSCSEDGPISSIIEEGGLTTTGAPPETEAPPATEAPEDAESESNEDLLLWLLVILVMALVGVAIWAAVSRRSQQKSDAMINVSTRVNGVIAAGNWLHDSASLEILGAPSAAVAARWQNVRPRAVELQMEAASLGQGSGSQQMDSALNSLAQTIGSFVGAMDGYVSLQATESENVSPELLTSARQSVEARRRDLGAAIASVNVAR